MNKKIAYLLCAYFLLFAAAVSAQQLSELTYNTSDGFRVTHFTLDGKEKQALKDPLPLFSLLINDVLCTTLNTTVTRTDTSYELLFPMGLKAVFTEQKDFDPGWKGHVTFYNVSEAVIKIGNFVPFGQSKDHIYLTAAEDADLAATKLYRPGVGPIGVVMPDNAWSAGYSAIEQGDDLSLAGFSRRRKWENADAGRWSLSIKPQGVSNYDMYADMYQGIWQNGLRMVFRDRWIYDLKSFDTALYNRPDLEWRKKCFIIAEQFSWDHMFYNRTEERWTIFDFLKEGEDLFGGYDIFGMWPTWPALGIDQRNQWDLYDDLPGGLEGLRNIVHKVQKQGIRFFIAFNPWDQSTRQENPYQGMARLISALDADGVVLDTQGSSSIELQRAADSVKLGVVMYSEGMAVPKDMPGIVSGRVHDAIYMPPPLNMNKIVKPDFSIFRVCQLRDGNLHREFAVSFFNGYGVEINTFGAGRPPYRNNDLLFLGKTTRLLRDHSSVFLTFDWLPLVPTRLDSVWVNRWQTSGKTIYTIFSLVPEGVHSPLFETALAPNEHIVDVWNHTELTLDTLAGKLYVPVTVDAFNQEYLGTRQEGQPGCIAVFKKHLTVEHFIDDLKISSERGDSIRIWAGTPSYQGKCTTLLSRSGEINLREVFGRQEGKFVIQLYEAGEVIDERIVSVEPGTARLLSTPDKTEPASLAPEGMIEVKAGRFYFNVIDEWSFLSYPPMPRDTVVSMSRFFMDEYNVTNASYKKFLEESGYQPKDTVNYLKHWKNGTYASGEGNMPVVYIALEDARAYAAYYGKRLPKDWEWQYAGQASDTASWPWGSVFDSTKCNNASGIPTAVDAFPLGASPFGVKDMIGNVWQLMGDVYDDGSYLFGIIRGGSYYKPTSSWWYVQGGPQPLKKRQMLLMVTPGYERNATVGFRCVKDALQ